jgi:hypothetical protein
MNISSRNGEGKQLVQPHLARSREILTESSWIVKGIYLVVFFSIKRECCFAPMAQLPRDCILGLYILIYSASSIPIIICYVKSNCSGNQNTSLPGERLELARCKVSLPAGRDLYTIILKHISCMSQKDSYGGGNISCPVTTHPLHTNRFYFGF